MRTRSTTLLLSCALAACARPSPPRDPAHPGAPRDAAPLRFDLAGQRFHVGVVRARVDGLDTLAIIDTGAERHVVDERLARRLDHPIEVSADTTVDAAGRVLALAVINDARIEVETLGELPVEAATVLELPSLFADLGIGMILSPQRAVADGEALRIDYREGTIVRVREGADRGLFEARPCGDAAGPSGPLYLVDGQVAGEPVVLALDTGADVTCLFSTSPVARPLTARFATRLERAYSVGGGIVLERTAALPVHVAGMRSTIELPILSRETPTRCGQDGQLGLDLLGRCVVEVSRAHARIRCKR